MNRISDDACTQWSVTTRKAGTPVITRSNYFEEWAMIECPKCGRALEASRMKVPERKKWVYGPHTRTAI